MAKSLVSTNSTIPAQAEYCTVEMETGHLQSVMISMFYFTVALPNDAVPRETGLSGPDERSESPPAVLLIPLTPIISQLSILPVSTTIRVKV